MITKIKTGLSVMVGGTIVKLTTKELVDYIIYDHPKVIVKAAKKKLNLKSLEKEDIKEDS